MCVYPHVHACVCFMMRICVCIHICLFQSMFLSSRHFSQKAGLGFLLVCFCIFISSATMVSIHALDGVSGANFNPAVSLALGIAKTFDWKVLAFTLVARWQEVFVLVLSTNWHCGKFPTLHQHQGSHGGKQDLLSCCTLSCSASWS